MRLGQASIAAVAGLQGYVGVDLVLGEPRDGSRDYVIEINPRLTTSYIGLRVFSQTNLAESMLRIFQGEKPSQITWSSVPVRFRADGSIVS
jgi:predicted ATP-grasp superfamily ATP-dependent carboligase